MLQRPMPLRTQAAAHLHNVTVQEGSGFSYKAFQDATVIFVVTHTQA